MLSPMGHWEIGLLEMGEFFLLTYTITSPPWACSWIPGKGRNKEAFSAQWSAPILCFSLSSLPGGGKSDSFPVSEEGPDKRWKTRRVAALLSGVHLPVPQGPRGSHWPPLLDLNPVHFSSLLTSTLCKEWVKEHWCCFPFLVFTKECNCFWFSCLTNQNFPQNSIRKEKQVNPAEGKDSRNPVSVTNRFMWLPEALKKKKKKRHPSALVNK